MQIDPMPLGKESKIMHDFRNNNDELMKHFSYVYAPETYANRVNDLKKRSFQRNELVQALHTLNSNWDAPIETIQNVNRLQDENSTVVIGGQQAGVFTGPMYTIHKVISILQLAKQQEEELGVPVIPVFWIAGEDHDFEEMNHLYMPSKASMKKMKVRQRVLDKKSISDITIQETDMNQWLEQVFQTLPETVYTKDLYEIAASMLKQCQSYVDFFARFIFYLFPNEGLVLVDSGHQLVRTIESTYFTQLIEKQSDISSGVADSLMELKNQGYSIALDAEPSDAHLFYHHHGERILLMRNEDGDWIGKQNEVKFSTDEILEIASHHPENLSNNVVTRPVMQELLFPTLAFIGGPGEIAYWSALKPAFDAVGLDMPPVVPRLSFTWVDRYMAKLVRKYNLSLEQAIQSGIRKEKEGWLFAQPHYQVHDETNRMKSLIKEVHQPFREIAGELGVDMEQLAEKNLSYLEQHIDFMERKIKQRIKKNHETELTEFDQIEMHFHPMNGLQERVWNPLYWINAYGPDIVAKLANERCSVEHGHYIVHL